MDSVENRKSLPVYMRKHLQIPPKLAACQQTGRTSEVPTTVLPHLFCSLQLNAKRASFKVPRLIDTECIPHLEPSTPP